MSIANVNIHIQGKETPKAVIEEYSDFYTVKITAEPQITLFFYSEQQVINFKNNLLWAFEKPIKITE